MNLVEELRANFRLDTMRHERWLGHRCTGRTSSWTRSRLIPFTLAGVTGIVITKLDGTARGGGALSAVAATGAPIVHIGVGENIGDLEKFESDRFISRLLGMGDIQGLIDLAPEDMDEEEAMRLTQRLMSGRFTLNDMYKQMEMMAKVGTIDKLMSFLPGSMLGGMGAMSKGQKEAMQGNLTAIVPSWTA